MKTFTICAVILLAFGIVEYASGHDHRRPDLNEWLGSLRNDQNQQCCTGPGTPGEAEELEWKADGGKYSVKIDGEWIEVPHEKVIKEPNLGGTARVWYYRMWQLNGKGSPSIRCFIPGTLS